MSSPDFDRQLKERLEEISPSYSPDVWTRIRGKMPVPFYLTFAQTTLPWLTAGVSTTALVWMIFQFQDLKTETKSLHNALDTATLTVRQSQQVLAGLQQKRQADTVFLVSSAGRRVETGNQTAASGLHQTNPEYTRQIKALVNATNGLRNENAALRKRIDAVLQSTASIQSNGSQTDATRIPFPAVPGSDDAQLLAKDVKRPAPSDSLSPFEAKVAIDSAKKEPLTVRKLPEKPPFRFSDLRPRLGFEAIGTTYLTLGIGTSFEMEVAENLGFSFGVIATKGKQLYFEDTDDFNAATGCAFDEEYKGLIDPEEGEIGEIHVSTSFIELPVRFKYYYPLRGKWSMLGTFGTHFDISAREKIQYETHQGHYEEYHTITNMPKTTFFHNFTFGLGAEYKGEKASFQISPFYTYNFRQSSIFENPDVFGLSMSIWLPLFKQ